MSCVGVYRAMPWEAFIAPFRVAALEQEWNRQHYSKPAQGDRPRIYPTATFSYASAAELLGVHPGSLRRWRKSGWVTLRTVEDVADRLQRHPLDLWGADYEAAQDKRQRQRKQATGAAGG